MANITLFAGLGNGNAPYAQVPIDPIQGNITSTFTPTQNATARVYSDGTNTVLTIQGVTWTVPNGTVEYFGVRAGQQVTVA